MTILTRFIVQCDPCERYLRDLNSPYQSAASVTTDTGDAAHFLDFGSAYNEAVRRGWSAFPLICGECAAEWREKVLGEQVRRDGDPEEDRRGLPESGQGPEGA